MISMKALGDAVSQVDAQTGNLKSLIDANAFKPAVAIAGTLKQSCRLLTADVQELYDQLVVLTAGVPD